MEDRKVPARVDYAAGIKAGVLAELVSLAFSFPAYLVSLYFRDPPGTLSFPRLVFFFIETSVPYAIALGLIIGIIFAVMHDKFLEGIALELKGMMFGLTYWLIAVLPFALQPIIRQFFFSSADFPISITGNLIFGLALGNLYRRFSYRPHNTVP